MYFVISTLGCKVNQYESSAIASAMEKHGFFPVSVISEADIFILNSCTVTENSDKKTRQLLNSAKNDNPGIITVLTGCFPQAFPDFAKNLGADILTGISEKDKLPELIINYKKNLKKIENVTVCPDVYQDFSDINLKSSKTRAFLKIEDGCDNNCAYCVIPRARGKVRSRSLESIKKEAYAAAKVGHKEIVLVGINLSRFGSDSGLNLCDAVTAVSEYTERVRLSSIEPDFLTDRILEQLSLEKKLCPHFHLSLQSGSDGVLKRMGRHYTTEEYYKIFLKLRSLFTNASFTTDIMTGFPGETDEELAESIEFARKIGFAKIHAFPYSIREGTPAASMKNQIPKQLKQERCRKLISVGDELRREFFITQLGKTHRVLAEKRIDDNYVFGHSENFTPVKVLSQTAGRHDIITTKIAKIDAGFCMGTEI